MGTAFSFYHDEPLFGLDIGHSSMKVMQLENKRGQAPRVLGYGVSNYYPVESITNGVITDFDRLAKALQELFKTRLSGSINTRRVACTVPTSHTFSRPLKLPAMNKQRLDEAVQLEAEQYIPVPAQNLYIDYDVLQQTKDSLELLVVATPKNIIDSYMHFLDIVGLEPVAIEPSMNATARLFGLADPSHDQPSVIVDFGSVAIDVAAFDKIMVVNSTINSGSDTITEMIAKKYKISTSEAYDMKNKYGIGYSDKIRDMGEIMNPILDPLVKEIKKVIRYHEDRTDHQQRISQIITLGGGATLPGLNKYLTKELDLPTRMLDPWHKIDFGNLQAPAEQAKSMYITVTGEAILDPKEVFA